jgi:predicted MPP superfamily phosphohydrolase
MTLTRRQFLWRSAVTLTGAATGTLIYAGRIEPHWIEVVERSLLIENLPAALSGKRLVQISDLHIGPRVDDQYLIAALNRVHDLAPDILVVTGDFMTYQGTGTFERLARVLDHLPHGGKATLAALGNHDYGHRWSDVKVADQLTRYLQSLGLVVLRNERHSVEGLEFVGLEDYWSPRFFPRGILSSLDERQSAIVLCHNPDAVDKPVWSRYRGWILAGHTHGGQCRPPFLPPPILPVKNKRYTAGKFDLGDGRWLYINRGLGHLIQVRFNVRPEITLFTLARA